MKIATLIKDNVRPPGHKSVYELDPPLPEKDYDDKVIKTHKYVLISAVHAPFTGPETYIFPSNKAGIVKDYGELDGSYQGGLSHREALRRAGYSVVSEKKKKKSNG